MSKLRPEALRLARMIEHYNAGVGSQRIVEDYQQAADELRRLYFENEKLRAALAEQPAPQPAKREPLTDEDIDQVTDTQWASNNHRPIYAAHRAYARAIERAHGIGEQE